MSANGTSAILLDPPADSGPGHPGLIRPANAASIRVAEKLGFRRDGTVELLGSSALVYASDPAR